MRGIRAGLREGVKKCEGEGKGLRNVREKDGCRTSVVYSAKEREKVIERGGGGPRGDERDRAGWDGDVVGRG